MLVAHFLEKGAKTVAVFHQDDGFGAAVLSGTEKALKKRGMNVATKSSSQRNTLAIKTGLAAMLEAKPGAIVMVGPSAPLAALIKEARAAGLKSQLATASFVGTLNLSADNHQAMNQVFLTQVRDGQITKLR